MPFIKRLTAAGMPEPQAEALGDSQAKLVDERLATKDDLANLATKADVAGLLAETKTLLAETKAELMKWLFGLIGFQTIVILGAVVALSHSAR